MTEVTAPVHETLLASYVERPRDAEFRRRTPIQAVLPDPALEAPDSREGDLVEPSEVLLVVRQPSAPAFSSAWWRFLGAGYRNSTFCDHPVEGDLARQLAPVLVTDAPQFGDDVVDDRHRVIREVPFAGGRMDAEYLPVSRP